MDPIPKLITAYAGGVALVSYCPSTSGGHSLVVDRITDLDQFGCVAKCLECSYYEIGRSYAEVLLGAAAKILKNWEMGWAETMEDGEYLVQAGRVVKERT